MPFTPPPLNSREPDKFVPPPLESKGKMTPPAPKGFGENMDQFWDTVVNDVSAIPGSLYQAVRHPIDTVSAIADSSVKNLREAKANADVGNYEAAGDRAARAVPLIGPVVADTFQDIQSGNYGRAAARGLELAVPEAMRRTTGAAIDALPNGSRSILRPPKNVNNPVVDQALQSVSKEVRMTPGQRTGQTALQTAERDLLNKPGTANEAHDFFAGQQEDLAKAGGRRVSAAPGQRTNAYGAGELVISTVRQRVTDLKSYADKLYDSTRKTTARNTKEVQTGVQDVAPSTILDPSGNPAIPAHQVPVMSTLETPVSLAPVRSRLKPIYDDLMRSLPEARRANSPAFAALQDLVSSDVQFMDAMDFDKFLSAVKSITRDGSSQLLTSKSQGLAAQVIKEGEIQFQQAIKGAGPNVADKLTRARKAVREYHDIADFIEDMNSEPAALYQNLTTGGDRVRDILGNLKRIAPKATETVGKTYLSEMMDKATREGGFGRSLGVKADWDRLGPETKKLLYGPRVSSDIDNFLLAAKKLTPNVGSPTADRLSALFSYGDVGMALGEFLGASFVGQPVVGALAAGGTLLKTRVQPRVLADIAFRPAGAQLLTQALRAPIGSPDFNLAMQKLNYMASKAGQSGVLMNEQRKENERRGLMPPPQRQPRQVMPPPGQ